ncbi:MAG TPA: tRNA (guanosine(46)-N7)-methyltransferase TrmB [Candidatus Limnocylindria bacterium]|nr:tRNA (guanosine(46)-N7)-methyltransferase TrmB [Candidatus Limnocylindria bacterium]
MEIARASEIKEPSIVFRPSSYVERLRIGDLFSRPQPLEIELGAGDGSFLVQWVALNPSTNFLGLERLLGRLRKIERKSRRAGLANVRVLRLEAAYFVEYLLPRESVSAFHIYFPDPWPKRKHRVHRLVNERFAEVLRGALTIGGTVYLRTDDSDYFAQMTQAFGANKNYEPAQTPERLATVLTDFERGFHAEGIATNRAAYRRIA